MFLFRVVLAIATSVLLYACGGGGGDSSPSVPTVPVVVVTPPPVVPVPVPAMTCSNNTIWSNPAVFSSVFQDCVAPIGVQALVTPSLNTMVDTTCVPTVGTTISTACKAYMANGTILIVDTSVIVNNHPTVWFAYIGADEKSNLVFLDSATMAPIGTMVLPGSLVWLIGNPTGVAISEKVGYSSSNGQVINSNKQVKWDGAKLVATCYTNCPI